VRFTASGRLHELPESLQAAIERGKTRTAKNTGMILNLVINYGGRAELVDACSAIAARATQGELDPAAIDEDTIRAELYSPELPDPDLIIRTGGEMRISNFLIWQAAYAELYVLPIFWPDFQKAHIYDALLAFAGRERRFGGVAAATQ
jgi:undecaprenyl diphosphate synthase